ncbi:DUF1592 domain-containing protein [Verrucomicrobiota bacterium sgz303538]
MTTFLPFRWLPVLCVASIAATASSAVAAPDFSKEVKPLLESYCFKCHADGKKKGGVSFDTAKVSGAPENHKLWDSVLENMKSGAMPPDDEKQPSLEEREKLTKWIEAVVFAVDPDKPDPGRVTIRRLNRTEYNNTIRDLVGVDFEAGSDFPTDDSGYGFDNIGDVLSLPPVLFERYLQAAEKVMSEAILNDHTPRSKTIPVDLLAIEGGPKKGSTPTSRKVDETEATVRVNLPVEGEYQVKLQVSSQRIGNEPTKLEVKFNGQEIGSKVLWDKKDAVETIKGTVKVPKAGAHTLSFRVTNPLEKPEMKDNKPVKRVFAIRKLDLLSPVQPVVAPPSQIRIFAAGRGQPTLEASARAIIANFGGRAFRRPLTPQEVDRFLWIYKQTGLKKGNFEQSVQTALTAILVSPYFLFRGELQPEPDNPKSVQQVNEWALASRLSYFLWSTMPDDDLFLQAKQGTLRKNLEAQVRRMLKDSRADALVENFAGQWLQIRNLRLMQPDAHTYPDWDKRLALAMERETEMLFGTIMREDRSVLEFLSADYTFVNERLADHYKIDGVEGDAFVKVKLPPNRPGGILGQGSFLTLTSNPTRTSPVKRGKYVLENLLGTPPPPPPPDVPDLNDAKHAELTGTLRQRMEQHRKDPTCASCHARMDPIGFGMENFDGIGAWRDKEGQTAIDSAGQLVSGEGFKGPAELRSILLTKKRGDFLRCITEKMMTYALGRGLEFYDKPTVEKIVGVLDKDPKFSTLVMEVAKSVPFQMRRGEGDHQQFSAPAKTTTAKNVSK